MQAAISHFLISKDLTFAELVATLWKMATQLETFTSVSFYKRTWTIRFITCFSIIGFCVEQACRVSHRWWSISSTCNCALYVRTIQQYNSFVMQAVATNWRSSKVRYFDIRHEKIQFHIQTQAVETVKRFWPWSCSASLHWLLCKGKKHFSK